MCNSFSGSCEGGGKKDTLRLNSDSKASQGVYENSPSWIPRQFYDFCLLACKVLIAIVMDSKYINVNFK